VTTATKTRTDPLAELERLDAAQAEADRATRDAETEHEQVLGRMRELQERRQATVAADPERGRRHGSS
jgi:hypothetical protein